MKPLFRSLLHLIWISIACVIGFFLLLHLIAYGRQVYLRHYAKNCSDFTSQAEAQKVYEADKAGRQALDRDHNGKACQKIK